MKVIYRFGAWTVPAVADGQWWRLVMPIFLHFDLLHLIFNSIWLVQLGPLIEQAIGRSRFLVLYLVTGRGWLRAVHRAQVVFTIPEILGLVASGVVFGLMGAALIFGYVRRVSGGAAFRAGLVKWIIFAVIMSFLPGIDLAAHLGGGIAGAGLAMVLPTGSTSRRARRLWFAAEIICIVAILASVALTWSTPTG